MEQQQIDLFISKYGVEKEKGIFDLGFWSKAFVDKDRIPSYSSLDGVEVQEVESWLIGLGLGKKLSIGTQLDFWVNNINQKSNLKYQIVDPYKKIEAGVSLTQPLLKGFGKNNVMSNLNIAQNNQAISEVEFKKQLKELKRELKRTYLKFSCSYHKYQVEKETLDSIIKIEDTMKEKLKLGDISQLEMLKIQVKVFQQKADLIKAENEYTKDEIELKKIMGMALVNEDWRKRYVPGDPFEIRQMKERDINELYKEGMINNYEYMQLKKEIENKEMLFKTSSNNSLPEVNLFLGTGIQGLSNNIETVLDQMRTSDYYNVVLGLEMKYAFGNRYYSSVHKEAKLKLDSEKLELKKKELEFFADLNAIMNNVRLSYNKAFESKRLNDTAQKRLDIELEKIQRGMIAYSELLEFLYELKEIKVFFYDAIYENNIALVELEGLFNFNL
jgi:outer membrane protein TolC